MNYENSSCKIIAVTVTYGKRWELLKQVVLAAISQGVAKVIIIDNGAKQDIESLAKNEFDQNVEVIRLSHNTGSAGGFSEGLKRAHQINPDYILLLDDDNVIQAGCIKALIDTYVDEVQNGNENNLALLAFRPVRLVDVANGISASRINPKDGSFFGFHFMDIPFKLLKRVPFIEKRLFKKEPTKNVYLKTASWSGLFIKPALIAKHGYPRGDFVLYADDTEYTLRISQSGGVIRLCTDALIEDIDQSWNLKTMYSNTFDGMLLGNSDFRAYYSTRNQSYLEYYVKPQIKFWTPLNRVLHAFVLLWRATALAKINRWHLLRQAQKDGRNQNLGINKNFPIN